MEDFVDFKVIKEKIIKTDTIINMFLDSKRKNAEFRKTIQLKNKQYQQLIADIAISNLENDRKMHQSEEQKRQWEKLCADNAQLKLDYSFIKDEYDKNLNELQILQIKYQSTCKELEECQISFDQYKKVSTEQPVKVQRKRGRKKNVEILEICEGNESRKNNHFSANETGESEEEGKLLEMKLTEKSEDITQQINIQLKKHLGGIGEIDNKADEITISNLKAEIEQLTSFINVLKKEVSESNDRNNISIKEWEDLLKSKEAEWSQREQKLRLEVAELKKRLELYDKQNSSFGDVKRSIFDCEEEKETKELAKCTSKKSTSDIWNQQAKQDLPKNLVDNGADEEKVQKLSCFPECVLEDIGDAEIECELPFPTEYNQSDSESVPDYINDIFGEMRMTDLVSPIPESEEDQIPLENNFITSKSPESQLSTVNNTNVIEPELNCHIPVEVSNESSIHNISINDRYNKLRQLKEKRLGNLLNIKKAKNLFWLRKGKLIGKSNDVIAKTVTHKINTCESKIDESIGKNEQDHFRTKKTSVDDIVTVLADLVSQKLKYPRPRKKSIRLNQIDDSRNVLEVNRMLLKKARQQISTSNICEKNQNSKDIMESDEHLDSNNTIQPNTLLVPPGEIASVEHLSKSSSSERSSSEVEPPIFDSCYESLISNPPSIENVIDDKKNIINWQNRNRIVSDSSNADGFQSNNISLNKETADLNIDVLDSNKHVCDQKSSSSPSQNAENSSGDHNFERKEETEHSHEFSSCNVKNELSEPSTKIEQISLFENCLHDHDFKIQNHNNENMDQKVDTLPFEHVESITEHLEIDNDNQILDIQEDAEMHEGENNLSLDSSESEVNEIDKLSTKEEDISDVVSNNSNCYKEAGTESKMILKKSNDESIQNEISNNSDKINNLGYGEEEDSTIHNNTETGYRDEKYKESKHTNTNNRNINSFKVASEALADKTLINSSQIKNNESEESLKFCENIEVDKQIPSENQKLDRLESPPQPKNVNENDVTMGFFKNNEGLDNSNELMQEYHIDKFQLIKDTNGLLPDILPLQNEKSERSNHDRFETNEKSIITHAEYNTKILQLEKDVDECQIEDFKQKDSLCSDNSLELVNRETTKLNDILQSDNSSINEKRVLSSINIESDYQFHKKNYTELVGILNSPILESEEGYVSNRYKLFSWEHDDIGVNSTETVQRTDWEEPTNRSNESMWYKFSHNIFRDIRISKSYNGNIEHHKPASGNFECETNRRNEMIHFKRNSEEELPNISKLSKLEDCDSSFESTNDSIQSEIEDYPFDGGKNVAIIGPECWTQSCINESNENNVITPNGPVQNGFNIETITEHNGNNVITPNDVVQEVESDKELITPGELNCSADMEIDLDISQHLLEEIEEEYLKEDSSVCVSSMINNLICETTIDVNTNYSKEVEISSPSMHHLVTENDTKSPECNENYSSKLNSDDNLIYSKCCGSRTEVTEATYSNNTDSNNSKSKDKLPAQNDKKNLSKKKGAKNSKGTSIPVICNYNLRKSSKPATVPVAGETLKTESLNNSNENNNCQENNKSSSVDSESIKTASLQNFNNELDLIGSFSESSDDEYFPNGTANNYKGFKLQQNRKPNNSKILKKKKVPTKKGFLMKKSIRTYKNKNLACNLVGQQVIVQTKDTSIMNGKSREEKFENSTSNILLNGVNSHLSENSKTSKLEPKCQDAKTYSDSLDEKKENLGDEIIQPQSSLFKRRRTHSGSYSVTSVKRTSRNIDTKTKKESKMKTSSSTCSVTDEISSNDFPEEIDGLGLKDITSHDKSEQNYETVKKIRKSLVDVENVNECSPKKIVKKSSTPKKSRSSFHVDHNMKIGSIGEDEQSIINSGVTLSSVNNTGVAKSCLREEKINILQDVIFRPATTMPKKLEIQATSQMKISGFKRPNKTKILPPCPMSPPPPSCEETISHIEPIIIPLEKPPKMESTKAAALFRKLITYSKEEKTVEEISRQFTSQDVDHISRLILEQITQDTERANKDHTSAPLMTDTQRVMLGFMLKLEQMNVENLIDTYLKISEMRLLQASTLQEIDTITRLYVAICKSHKYIERMRRMCCDAFYFMGDLAIPFLFIVLVSWIEVLPMEEEMSGFPMVKVMIQLVNLKTCNFPGYNLLHLRDLLTKYYNYPSEPWNTNSFFQELFTNYLKNPVRPNDFAILLYCKNNTSEWVYEKINNLIKSTLANIRNENFKATVIILIGNIISQFNGKVDGEYVASVRQWFKTMIEEEGVSEVVKKSIILSLRKLPKTTKKTEINNIVNKR